MQFKAGERLAWTREFMMQKQIGGLGVFDLLAHPELTAESHLTHLGNMASWTRLLRSSG
jgi:hypothetical protein